MYFLKYMRDICSAKWEYVRLDYRDTVICVMQHQFTFLNYAVYKINLVINAN